MNVVSKFTYQLYLFQLENYHIGRYFKLALKNFGRSKEMRQTLVWTPKLKALSGLSIVLLFLISVVLTTLLRVIMPMHAWLSILIFIVLLFGLSFFNFIYLILSSMIIAPLDYYLKNRIIKKATAKIKTFKNLRVIGIAGSYGKTTTKEIITKVLSEEFSVLETPENINTPLGISELINSKLNEGIEVFIVEMGEYTKGDVQQICEIVHPTTSILTGINEAHFERMGSLQNAADTIFELVQHSSGLVVLNADDHTIIENYKKYASGRETKFYSAHNNELSEYRIVNPVFRQDASGYSFELYNNAQSFGTVTSKLLGEYSLGTIVAGVIVGNLFGIQMNKVQEAIAKTKPVPHRLEPIINPIGTIVIDDSYNGNPDGVREAIEVLGKFSTRRKVYITPGLVETGSKAREIHERIGNDLGKVADIVILIKNSVSDYILSGLAQDGFPKENIFVFNTIKEAHGQLASLIRKDDVVLFQNDWPDNYA